MRIGLVVESLDPRRGGVEQWSYQFVQRVLAQGHAVHVVARECRLPDRSLAPEFHRVEATGRLAFAAEAERQLRSLSLDVIHDTGCGWQCDVLQPHGGARRAAFEQNLLLLPRWLRPLKRLAGRWAPRYREFERLMQRQYDAPGRLFIAISKMVARDLVRWHGASADRVRLVYNGVDLQRFSPALRDAWRERTRREIGVADDETLLLIVAHNFRLKGVATLLAAGKSLLRSGARVRIAVAGGKRVASWRALAERLGVGRQTHWLGAIDDPAPLYAAADVYVQPTFYDPCSLVVLEALACGLPTITSRFNGAGELITPGWQGNIVCDPSDPTELAAAIEPFLEPATRVAAGQAARALAEQHSWAQNVDQILAIYREAAGLRRAA